MKSLNFTQITVCKNKLHKKTYKTNVQQIQISIVV